jgi:hypothetical protein
MRPRVFLAIAGGAALLAAAGCGGSDSSSGKGSPFDNKHTSTSSGPSPSGPGQPAGNWKHQPGQAGKVQQTLTAAGFECTRHGDTAIDLRLCAKGLKEPDNDQLGGPALVGGQLRYYSAPDGTVLFAKITSTGDSFTAEWDTMRAQMFKAVLPANDAAVIVADGDTLTWGKYIKDPAHSTSDGWLQVAGYDDPSLLSPSGEALRITKEQALPKMTGAKLKCSFDDLGGSGTNDTLSCSDETFKTNPDAYYSAATNLELSDTGAGINNILVQGKAGKFADDVKAAKHMLPKLSALGDTTSVPAIQDWANKHLDGVPHSAYVGKWLVEIAGNNNESSMTGTEFDVNASEENPALGYDPSKIGTD